MQAFAAVAESSRIFSFSILIGSGGDARIKGYVSFDPAQCFSILIGSGGDASFERSGVADCAKMFQYPHRIGW